MLRLAATNGRFMDLVGGRVKRARVGGGKEKESTAGREEVTWKLEAQVPNVACPLFPRSARFGKAQLVRTAASGDDERALCMACAACLEPWRRVEVGAGNP